MASGWQPGIDARREFDRVMGELRAMRLAMSDEERAESDRQAFAAVDGLLVQFLALHGLPKESA